MAANGAHRSSRRVNVLLVGAGGALGAVARHLLGGWVSRRWPGSFPLGTLLINVGGSFLLGLLMALAAGRLDVPDGYRLLLGVGFLGGFTTFSTLTYDTLVLLERGDATGAALNALGSLALGLVACALGMALGRLL